MYGSWESLTLGQNGESVGEVSNVVLMWNVLSLDWLVTLYLKVRIQVDTKKRVEKQILTLSGSVGSNLATP